MQKIFLLFLVFIAVQFSFGQNEKGKIQGTVLNSSTGKPIEGVHILNLNQVRGTTSNKEGVFRISAKANDTLHFSYLGFKSINIKVNNDWVKFGATTIELTEAALALEEVVVSQLKLTGYLALDIKQIPITTNNRYRISGLSNQGYEGNKPNVVNKVLGAIFNPVDFLYGIFGKKPKELRKLKQMKEDDVIRNELSQRFDREMITTILGVSKYDLDEIVNQCNYSKDFVKKANDLQILDAIAECYEEYKVLIKNKK